MDSVSWEKILTGLTDTHRQRWKSKSQAAQLWIMKLVFLARTAISSPQTLCCSAWFLTLSIHTGVCRQCKLHLEPPEVGLDTWIVLSRAGRAAGPGSTPVAPTGAWRTPQERQNTTRLGTLCWIREKPSAEHLECGQTDVCTCTPVLWLFSSQELTRICGISVPFLLEER